MLTFSSSVIWASRRAARSSGDSDVFSHGLSCGEASEPVLVFSMLFPPFVLDAATASPPHQKRCESMQPKCYPRPYICLASALMRGGGFFLPAVNRQEQQC